MRNITRKQPGVYERKSEHRNFLGKPDVCFYVTYKKDRKKIWEKIGWLSEGYSVRVASQLRAERIRSLRHGEQLPKQKPKAPYFKDAAQAYIEWAKDNRARYGRDDESRYRKHLAPLFGEKRISDISSFDLERLKTDLTKREMSPASIKHCLVVFRQIVNKAITWGLYKGDNPIKGVKMPVIKNQRDRFLSYDEADTLLTELEKTSKTVHDMALISLHCGLRAGEIFNLKGQDLNFENSIINIADPKNKESRKAYMTEAVKETLLARKPDLPDEYVFKARSHGGKIQRVSNAYARTVNKLKFNDGIEDPRHIITFHSLRHTFASWLASQGETILTIKELLGHKTLAMTARYAHLMPDQKRQATAKLENIFKEKRDTNANAQAEQS